MTRNQLMRNRAMVSYKTQLLYGKKCGPMVGWLPPVNLLTTPPLQHCCQVPSGILRQSIKKT
jgi:hypothetical protein